MLFVFQFIFLNSKLNKVGGNYAIIQKGECAMFTRMIISKVKKELERVGFECDSDVMLIKVYENKYLLKVFNEDKSYVVEFYENEADNKKYYNLSVMEKYGIESLPYYVNDPKIFVYKDIDGLSDYRFANKDDLENEKVIKGMAKWYKKLHECNGDFCKDLCELFSLNNIKEVMEKLKLNNNKAMCYICDNFKNIKLKIDRLNKCFVCGGFSLQSLVISCDYEKVFINDFSNVSLGYRYLDLRSVLCNLEDREKEIFLKEYGIIKDDEIIIDKVFSVILTLIMSINNSSLSFLDREVVDCISNGKLYEWARSLVEWY